MSPRLIALVAATALVLGAVIVLFVEVRASPTIEVPEEALAQARARYDRSQSERARARPKVPTRPVAPARPAPSRAEREDEPEPEPRVEMSPSNRAEAERRAADVAEKKLAQQQAERDKREDVRERRERVRAAYDSADYEVALSEALELLPLAPTNRYVLRVAVTAACATGKNDVATEQYGLLFRDEDRRIVRTRCARYGIEL
ncbi:hypothetical protein [Haliangium sp.]|uniref:hypothetical protein n=1 Tax=Haliangium sp. TaxID=2663208 RepID=UPI003D0C9D7B